MSPKETALYLIDACEVRAGQRWKHTKTGNSYTIVALGIAEATFSPVVVYAGADGVVWVRALAVFLENNDDAKPRFILVTDDMEPQTLPFARSEWRPTDVEVSSQETRA